MIYTSRYSNPELRSGKYTAVRISLGTPKWPLGYVIESHIPMLMPAGIFGKYDSDPDAFRVAYYQILEKAGVNKIRNALARYEIYGKDVVLLCYEDIRKPGNYCHRTMFADWWKIKTGQEIPELYDPTPDPGRRKAALDSAISTPNTVQLSLFD